MLVSSLVVLGASWLQVGVPVAILAPSWGVFGMVVAPRVGGVNAILAPSFEVLGQSCLQVGWSWCHLGPKLGGIRAILAPSLWVLGQI